jgi:predicted amidophosphoribosyltransferase
MHHVEHFQELCARCGKNPVRASDQAYCKECHAEVNREHRARARKTRRELMSEIFELRNEVFNLKEQLKQQHNGKLPTTPP